MKILAIDYGEKRMGFAIGSLDSEKKQYLTTTALKPLNRKINDLDIQVIKKIISDYDIQKIIIGFPLNMDGSKSPMSEKTKHFGNEVKKKTGIAPEYVDERLSSFEAGEMLKAVEPDRRRIKKKLDSTAALVILNNYLEKE